MKEPSTLGGHLARQHREAANGSANGKLDPSRVSVGLHSVTVVPKVTVFLDGKPALEVAMRPPYTVMALEYLEWELPENDLLTEVKNAVVSGELQLPNQGKKKA
jgi:hypothetical protein